MTTLDEVLAQLRRDHAQGRITVDERATLWRIAREHARAGRNVWRVLAKHARDRSR